VLGDHIEAFSVGQVAAIIIIVVVVVVVVVIVVAVVVVFDWRGRGAAPPSPSFASAAGEEDRIDVVVLRWVATVATKETTMMTIADDFF
jgi:flagellar basal body-associated protein FliL